MMQAQLDITGMSVVVHFKCNNLALGFSFHTFGKIQRGSLVTAIQSKNLWPGDTILPPVSGRKCCCFPRLNKTKTVEELILCSLAVCSVELMGRAFCAKLQFNELSHPDCFVYNSLSLTLMCLLTTRVLSRAVSWFFIVYQCLSPVSFPF